MAGFEFLFQDVAPGGLRLPLANIQTDVHRSYRDYTHDESRLAALRSRLHLFGLQTYRPLYIVLVPAPNAEITADELAAITLFSRIRELLQAGQARSMITDGVLLGLAVSFFLFFFLGIMPFCLAVGDHLF